MSTPTTTRGALLRRAGALLVAAALVAGPATAALAEPTTEPSPTASASGTASASPSPSPTTTPAEPSTSPTPTASVSATPAPEPSTGPAAPTGSPAPAARVAGLSESALLAASASVAPQTAAAADFVARTLAAGGDHYVYPKSTWFDGGNTIDGIIALAASGTGRTQMGESLAYLEANLGGYTGVDYGDLYVGGTAKTIIGVVAAGGDPRSFAGTDLVADLRGLEVPSGRFSDTGSGDYTITITQALAVIALVRAGEPLTSASVKTLVDQQCADGGFRSSIEDPEGCVSDPDVTGFAAQALIAAGATNEAGAALDRLAAVQGADGSMRSADGTANANTTGVAAQAFAAGGRDADLARAQAFLASLQYGCSSPAALRGGLAFSAAARSTTTIDDSDLRATPQGTLALAGDSLLSARVSEGASSGTTALACGTTPTRPTTNPTSTVAPTQGAGPGASGDSGDAGGVVASGPTGSLAQTGSDLLLPVGLGLALVLVGAMAVGASRRRGAHA